MLSLVQIEKCLPSIQSIGLKVVCMARATQTFNSKLFYKLRVNPIQCFMPFGTFLSTKSAPIYSCTHWHHSQVLTTQVHCQILNTFCAPYLYHIYVTPFLSLNAHQYLYTTRSQNSLLFFPKGSPHLQTRTSTLNIIISSLYISLMQFQSRQILSNFDKIFL